MLQKVPKQQTYKHVRPYNMEWYLPLPNDNVVERKAPLLLMQQEEVPVQPVPRQVLRAMQLAVVKVPRQKEVRYLLRCPPLPKKEVRKPYNMVPRVRQLQQRVNYIRACLMPRKIKMA